MLKKLFFFGFSILSLSVAVHAQNLANSTLESSSATSLNASGPSNGQGISVDKYTGKLQAGFTLYSYQNSSTGLQHSISLNYKGGGICVDDIASNVGLGWSLNTGGNVVRNINGLPDEGVFDNTGTITLAGFSSPSSTTIPTTPNGDQLSDYAVYRADGAYDDFSYSAGGQSGSFHIGKDGSILEIPLSNVKIEELLNGYSPGADPFDSCYSISFRITLPDGTKYIYSNFDCAPINYNDTFSFHKSVFASSTWYLSKIIAPFNKDSICFDYTPVVQSYIVGNSFAGYFVNGVVDGTPWITTLVTTQSRDMRLTDIRYPDGTVVNFNYDPFYRLDVPSDNALNNITITNGTTSYGYKFNYSYMHNSIAGVIDPLNPYSYQDYSATPPADTNQVDYRLTLNNYTTFSNTDTIPDYSFLYYPAIPVPRGYAFNVDNWGFYSSIAGGRVPMDFTNVVRRNADNGSENSSLAAVILPTGGNIQLQYENNTYKSTYIDTEITSTVGSAYNPTTTLTIQDIAGGACKIYDGPSTSVVTAVVTSPAPTTGVTKQVSVTIGIDGGYPDIPSHPVSSISIQVVSSDLTHIYGTAYFSPSSTGPQVVTFNMPAASQTFEFLAGYSATGPVYSGGSVYSPIFDISWTNKLVDTTITITPDTVNTVVGGIRVTAIVTSDSTGQNNQITKQYQYNNNDGWSSGILGNLPVYSFNYTENYQPSVSTPFLPATPDNVPYFLVTTFVEPFPATDYIYNYTVYTSQAENSLMYTHGSPVGYSQVEEYLGTAANYKKENVYNFTSQFSDTTGIGALFVNPVFPYAPGTNLDFVSGLPIAVYSYNSAGLLLSKTQTQYNTYLTPRDDNDFLCIKAGVNYYPTLLIATHYSFLNYYPVTGKVFPVSTTQTTYFTGNDSLVSITSTTYDTANMVVRQTATTDAFGIPVTTNYYYPYDFSLGSTGAIPTLQSNGMIYSPIRTETWKIYSSASAVNTLMSSSVSSLQQLADGSVMPYCAYMLTVTDPVSEATWGAFDNTQLLQNASYFTQSGTIDQYDNKGNILQVTNKGVSTSTIWGYNQQRPIARIANARYKDVAYTSFENGDYGSWVPSGPFGAGIAIGNGITGNSYGVLSSSNFLRKTGLNPSKTYIISFWIKGAVLPKVSTGTSMITLTASDSHKGWTLYKATFTGTTMVTVLPGIGAVSTYLDELRLYPQGAVMTTSTYDPLFGVTSKCDASNRTMYTEYDGFGRVKVVRDMDGNIINKYDYTTQAPQY